jgi:hypothetical protein
VVFVLLSVSILTVVLTNGLGNVLIILGIGVNFPTYQEARFRKLVAMGTLVSLLLQPEQFIYFLFLYLIRLLKTQDHEYRHRNWWLFIVLGRIVILLSKVSLLTFLIGLFQSRSLVLFTLMFRTVCAFFGKIIVFMGTEDDYSYFVEKVVPKSIVIDLILWAYFLLLRIYSSSSSSKFSGTNITNIFEEYPLINYVEGALRVLKVFHWVAYISISFFILNSSACLFTLLRILPLLMCFVVGILESHKSQLSYNLWSWNFYTALSIAFVKYFYLLSQYSNLSPWLVSLLEPLIVNHKYIGLTPPDKSSLLLSFGPDFLLILLNAVMLFIIRVEVSELNYITARKRICEEQGLEERLLEEKEEAADGGKNIHYLYKKYIRPIDMRFKEESRVRVVMTDYIVDLCFLCFLIISETFSHGQNMVYFIPHYLLFFYGFWKQKGKHYPSGLFNVLLFICSVDLLLLYIRYFVGMIQGTEVEYDLPMVISKYCLLVLGVVFKQLSNSLEQYYNEISHTHPNHNFLLFRILAPRIPDDAFRKEVIVLYLNWNKVFALACFLAELLSAADPISTFHLATLIAIAAAILVFSKYRKDIYKRHWMYFLLLTTFIDLWNGHLTAIFCLFALRGYYMFLEEFDLEIFMEKYDRSNRTDNEETKRKVEEEEAKMKEKYHFPEKDRMEVIEEANEER